MKHLRKFDSVSDMNTVIANSTIGILGLAYNNGTPVMKVKTGSTPVPPTPSYSTPFYVENITNSNETLTIVGYDRSVEGNYVEIAVEYSTDGTTWSSLGTTGATPLTRTLQPSDKVYLRAETDTWTEYDVEGDSLNKFNSITGVSKVGGNIMSLLYGSSFAGNETVFPTGSNGNFIALFTTNEDENTELISASELILPATTLTAGCYNSMFGGCTALTTAPALPATTLADYCYEFMFSGCSSLITAPVLPATTLADYCYQEMFEECTSLTTAPLLPATTLTDGCYCQMFYGCESLNEITIYANDISAEDCLTDWLYNVSQQGTFNNMGSASYPDGASGNPWATQK